MFDLVFGLQIQLSLKSFWLVQDNARQFSIQQEIFASDSLVSA
jgi:hypothetical protein